jgi:dihydrolipoamide dehydrogenase
VFDLIVIGGGPGGYEAAAHAGREGRRVALVEKRGLGGTCLNVGCIPAKTFLRSSRLVREVREAGGYGVRVEAATLDLAALVARKNRVVDTLVTGVAGMLKDAGVEVITGEAHLADRGVVAVDGERLPAANVLVATGSRPAVPPVPGLGQPWVLDNTSAFELTEAPSSVAVVGGGYIGLEFATFFSDLGVEVAVFEMLDAIAAGCDGDVSRRLLASLRRSGVTFHLGCRVLEVTPGAVRYADTDGTEHVHVTDRVLNATGRVPAVGGLGLEGLGADVTAKGLPITPDGRTNVPGIWACGDVTGSHMLAHVATREGIVAVNSMFGRPDRTRYDAVPAVIYTHPEVAMAGRTEEQLRAAGVAYRKALVPAGVSGRFLIENEAGAGFAKVLVDADYGNLLGVHVMGDTCSEFIVAAAALIETELPVVQALEIVFPHPTVAEVLREALLRVG